MTNGRTSTWAAALREIVTTARRGPIRRSCRRSSILGHFLVKRVTHAGTFRFKHRLLFIANALKQHHIGLEEIDDGIWSIYFNRVLLARLDERDYIIRG